MRKLLGRMTRRGIVTLLAGLLVTLPLGVNAAKDQSPVLAQIAKWGKIRIGMSGGQPPYNVVSREGKLIGMDVDIAELLAKSLDVQLELVEMNFNELLPALESGKVDLVISGMTATLQRNMRAAFVGPYHITGKSILTRSETIAALGSNDLNRDDLRIAALKGSTSEDFVRRVAPNAKVVATDTYDDAIDQLLANKAELFVADASIIMLSMMRWPDAGLSAAQRPLTIEPIGIAVPASDPLLLNLVENYMKALESSGALEKLEEKWFKSGGWLVQLP
ncbi:MAG: transporter substrate-binding domain-containing protein [Pseudomonadales bacterium]|nr:transporter substrate-binding domain-containing protein [Pseudomonadales bacterium]NIX08304.1 transporter substrate-binding domain-containing protein [Pseudomonadales bacterium]